MKTTIKSILASALCAVGLFGAGSAWAVDPDYLSFTAKGGSVTIKLEGVGGAAVPTLETSADLSAWAAAGFVTGVELADGQCIFIRQAGAAARGLGTGTGKYVQFKMEPENADTVVLGGGSVMSLLNSAAEEPAAGLADYAFYGLFDGCDCLRTAPELTAGELSANCCGKMFNGCSNLVRVVIANTNMLGLATTPNWLNGVAEKGTFILPKSLMTKIMARGINTVPAGWTLCEPATVTVPATVPNATLKVSTGDDQEITPLVPGQYTFGRYGEDAKITVIPAEGYIYTNANPITISPVSQEAYTIPEAQVAVTKGLWKIVHGHDGTTTYYAFLSDAFIDLHDNDTLSYCGDAASVETDCDFTVTNKAVTVNLGGKKLDVALTIGGAETARADLAGVQLVNGALTKGAVLNYGRLTLGDSATVTNTAVGAATISCTGTCNELAFGDGVTKDAILGLPKIALIGEGTIVYTKPAFTKDTEIIAIPSDNLLPVENGTVGEDDHYYMAGYAKVVNVDTRDLYYSIISALEDVTTGETLAFRTNIAETVLWDGTKAALENVTLSLSNFTWSASDPSGCAFTLAKAGSNVTVCDGSIKGQVRLDAAGLVLGSGATITNELPIAVTNACSLALDSVDQLIAEGAKICLFGVESSLTCETELELDTYIVAWSDPNAKYPNKVYKPDDNLYAVAQPGSYDNPWPVGADPDEVYAYTNGVGRLIVYGSGKMKDFTADDPAPWNEFKGEISSALVGLSVSPVGKQAFGALNNGTEVIFEGQYRGVDVPAFHTVANAFNEGLIAELLIDADRDYRVRPGAWTNAAGVVYTSLKEADNAGEEVVSPLYTVPLLWASWWNRPTQDVRLTINNLEATDHRVMTISQFKNMAEPGITNVEFKTTNTEPAGDVKSALADAITNALPKAALKPQFNFHYDYVNYDVLTNGAAAVDVEFAKPIEFDVTWAYTTGSVFRVARYHGGTAALIPYVAPSAFEGCDLDEYFTYDPEGGLLKIYAKKFSPFAIGSYDGAVAKIADVTYPSISSAFASIQGGNPTIEVFCDVSDSCDMQAPEDASVILDFAGFSNEVDTVSIGALKGALTVSNGVINANTIATTADFTGKVYFRAIDLCETDLNITNGIVRICSGVKSVRATEFAADEDNLRIIWDGEPASKFAFNQKKFLNPKDGSKDSPVFAFSDDDDKVPYTYKVIPLGEVDFRLVKADGTWTDEYFLNDYEAFKAADTNDYLVMYKNRSADLLLGDGEPGYGDTNDVNAISKNIRFSTATNVPPTTFAGEIHAIRHDETFYTEKTFDELTGTDRYVLTKRGAPSRRLTLEIVGRGRVKIGTEPSYHENPGDQTWIDYSELTTNTWYTLTAKPAADGEYLFWRWEDANTNRLDYWTNEVGTVFCAYDDTIQFRMGMEDTKLRIVFLPKDDDRVLPHDVRIVINPNDAAAGAAAPAETVAKLDGKTVARGDSLYLFSDIKGGEHTVETAPNEANSWRFLNWVTNNVIVENSAVRFDNYLVEPACTNITARFIPDDHVFEVTAAATNVFDWSFHGLEYVFTGWEAEHTRLEFCTNNLTWATNYPSYVHAGDYEIKARVLWNLEKSVDELTEADTADLRSGRRVIIPCPLTDASIVASVSAYAFVGADPEIDLTFTPNGYHLVSGTDFTVVYDAEGGLGHAKVTGIGDFCESLTLDYNILREITVDGVTYYLQATGGVYNAAIARVDDKTGDAGVYHVPAEVTDPADGGKTYTVVDIVPGAFTNSPDIVKLVIPQKVNLWGNIIWGLEKLEEIDFAGYGPEDSPYYFYKLGTEFNGARVLVKSNMDTTPGEIHWDTDTVKLLGTVVAGDSFDVVAKVTKIAPTAFAGNPYLFEINLHSGVAEIGGGLCQYLDMSRVVFTLPNDPGADGYLEKYFRSEFRIDMPGQRVFIDDGSKWTTFNWNIAEAKIESKGYYTFEQALQAARNGQTVVALTNLFGRTIPKMVEAKDEGEGIVKRIILDAKNCFVSNLTIEAGAEVGIVDGTFDEFEKFNSRLVKPSSVRANPVMEKWYDANDKPWWTVIDESEIVVSRSNENAVVWYRNLTSAAQDAESGDTIAIVRTGATGVVESFTVTKDVTFVYGEQNWWQGTLTADGATVHVQGNRGTPGGRKFSIVNDGKIYFVGFNPGQESVADEGYTIVSAGKNLWQLVSEESFVAEELRNPDERFADLQWAAVSVGSAKILIIKDNDQSITATRPLFVQVANGVVWGGALANDGNKVTTMSGSTFGRNLGTNLTLNANQKLANLNTPMNGYSNVWRVVTADKVVAQIEGRDPAEYFLTVEAAADQAMTGETITILNQVDNPVILSDENIQKMLKFRDDNDNLKGGVKAERHDDFYEWKKTETPKDSGIYVYELVLKDMPTHKLEFEIIGEGGVYVTNKPAHVVRLGYAYADLKPGEWYELKGVPEFNGKDAFWRWENADGTRLASWSNDCDQVNCAYDDVIRFQMLNEDMKLRAVFKKSEDCVRSTLTVYPDNWLRTTFPGGVTLDGKKNDNTDTETWTFEGVKPGDHELLAVPHREIAQYEKFVCWIIDGQTNDVDVNGHVLYVGGQVIYDNPYVNFEFGASNAAIVARWTSTNIWSAAENVRKTYDGIGTNITVTVRDERKDSMQNYKVEYLRLDIDGAPWTEESPVFTDAGVYEVAWHVLSKGAEDRRSSYWRSDKMAVVDEGVATVTIDPASLTAADSLVYIGLDRQYIILGKDDNPKVIGRYLDFDLKNGVDFEVTYSGDASVGTATATVTGIGNYSGAKDLLFNVYDKLEIDNGKGDIDTYLDNYGAGVVLQSVAPGSCTTTPDGKLEFAVPESITIIETDKRGGQTEYTLPVIGVAAGAFDNIPEVQRILFPVEVEIYGNIIRGLENLEYIDFWGMDEKSWDADYKYKKLGEEHGGAGILLKKPVMDSVGPFGAGLPPQPYDLYDFNGWELIGVADAANVFSIAGGFDLDKHVDIEAIGADAFAGNTNLIEIALTNGVKWLQPGLIEQSNIDTNLMFFSMSEEPTEEIKNFFAGEGLSWTNEPDVANRWTTFNWGVYDARIINSAQEKRGYYTLAEAFEAATDGQTVEVMRDIYGPDGHSYTITGKAVVLDAKNRTLTNMKIDVAGDGELRILAGTFGEGVLPGTEADYQNLLQAGKVMSGKGTHWFTDPVFEKWYTADESPSSRWTVIEKSDIVCTMTNATLSANYRTLSDAAYDSKGGEVLELIKAKGVKEDVTFTHDITFLGSIEGRRWKGLLTAADGAIVLVKGTRATKDGNQKFAVENGGTVQMDYFAGQCAVADQDNYSIVRVGLQLWQLLLTSGVVAQDLKNDDDCYYDMQLAADNIAVASGETVPKMLVVKDNDQPITATRDFLVKVATNIVWGGALTNGGHKVTTVTGSTFGRNLGNDLTLNANQALAYDDDEAGTWTVVAAGDIVAQVRHINKPVMKFTSAQAAFDWLRAYVDANPGEAGNFYGIDIVGATDAINLNGKTLNWPIFMTVDATLAVTNGVIAGDFTAVQGDLGQVIFGKGLRMPDTNTVFQAGSVELTVVAGAYINDPTEFCEDGYSAMRRAKVGDPLNGYYVVYPNSECEVTIVDGTHLVHYRTFQDAIDLATADETTVQLFNNGMINATVWSDKKIVLTSDPNGAAQPVADLLTNSEIIVEGDLVVSNLTLEASKFIVRNGGLLKIYDTSMLKDGQITVENGGKFVAHDGFVMSDSTSGAVIVKDGGQFVLNGNVKIWDNNGKNVVIENAETGFLLKNRGTFGADLARVGITCENGNSAGAQFGMVDNYPFDLFAEGDNSGDNSNAPIFCDTNPDLRVGRGKTIVGPIHAETNSVRYINDYTAVLYEGKDLITRSGNELVWLECVRDPVAAEPEVLGKTRGTLTIGTTPGFDYAFVTNDIAFTNWMSATTERLTFTNLVDHETYTLLKRCSITEATLVSDFVVEGAGIVYRTSKYNAEDVARWFEDRCDTFVNEGTLDEMAENQLVKVTASKDGDGYVVTMKKDSNHDWAIEIPDDAGKLVLDMHGFYLNAKDFQGKAGLSFVAVVDADYDGENPTDLTIENRILRPYDHPSRIVGSRGANGANAVDTGDGMNGVDGAVGITNMSARAVTLTINGGIEVYGGTGGNGGNAVSGNGGAGGNGGDAIAGNIWLYLNGASIFGGLGGNGGTSTYVSGGQGGNGGDAIAASVAGEIVSGGIYGGNGGNGGGIGDAATGKAGKGGNGGMGLVHPDSMIDQGGDFSGDIEIRGGKGGVPNGDDGKGGKPAAPAPAKVLNLTGTSVTLGVIESCEYYFLEGVIDPDKTTIPDEDGWYKATDNEWFTNGLKRATTYTVVARIPAKDGNLVSFYSSMTFTTMNTGATDLENVFYGKGTVTIDGNGEYVVTLTGDIDHGVRIPDHCGKFTLDMAGHAIVGLDGVKDVSPDGETAILFVPGGQDELTEVTITGDGYIKGGDGAMRSAAVDGKVRKPNEGDGGNGGAGIAAEPLPVRTPNDPVVSNKVNFLSGTLEGGAGAKGADTLKGIAGNGGNGGDAYLDIERYPNYGVLFNYVGGTLVGGNGGNGGDAIGSLEDMTNGTPGNGGNGGDAINGQGGNGGNGGKSVGGNRFGQGGEEGNKGMEAPSIPGVPGGVSGDYLVRIGDPGSVGKVRYFMTLEEAFDAAKKDETITVFRDYTTVCPIEVCVNNLTLQTAGGATLTLDENIIVYPEIEFTIAANCEVDENSIGTIEVNGTVNQKGSFAPNYAIMQDGAVIATAGKIGYVAIEEGGRFQVEYKANVTVKGSIDAWNPMNVFLFGGTYEIDPSGLVRDPFMIEGEDPWAVVIDPKWTAMARVDDEIWGIETLDDAFSAITDASEEIEVWLLKDTTASDFLIDQKATTATIHGNGFTVCDQRTGTASEKALFNISGNVTLDNVTFDGCGSEQGPFLRQYETATVVLDGCKVTGYACKNNGFTRPLISCSSAGEKTCLIVKDTKLVDNDVSSAINTICTSSAGFTYKVYLSGATTITNSGVGISSDNVAQLYLAGDLTGGWIDVANPGTNAQNEFGRISGVGMDAEIMEKAANHFRYSGKSDDLAARSCGHVWNGTDGVAYLAWEIDARQYVAIIVRASGETNYFETAEGAFGAVANKDTIILMQDATVGDMMTAKLTKATDSYIVDLNGKTLTNDGNKLKLGTAAVKIMNGTLAAATKYALYVYGATVALSNTVIAGDAYVAKGKLAITVEDVGVKGAIDKTNAGSISITAGLFAENPSAYLPTNRGAFPADDASKAEGYNWIVGEATAATGFADGFKPDISFGTNGVANIDLSVSGIGKIRKDSKIVYDGDVMDKVHVIAPVGWIVTCSYSKQTGKTTIQFVMDYAEGGILDPQLGTLNPGDRPLVFEWGANGKLSSVTIRIKNAVPGFFYKMMGASALNTQWQALSTVQATVAGELSLETPNATVAGTYNFYKVSVTDDPTREPANE